MRTFILTICIALVSAPALAQTENTPPAAKKTVVAPTRQKTATAAKQTAKPRSQNPNQKPIPGPPVDDKAEFEKAAGLTDVAEKISALSKFLTDFPASARFNEAAELLSVTAFAAAEERLAAGDSTAALPLYKLAAESAPKPVPEKLFNDSLLKIPTTLFWRGNRIEALDIAKTLESKAAGNSTQLTGLAMFHIGIENGDDAVRLAEKAVEADPASSKARQTLGLAHRVNFQLEESAAAYAKAVELEPTSTTIRRSLAEIKRALGKPDESAALYREILTADESDLQARNGLILSLFDSDKKTEAENELAKSLEQNPSNVMLLAGAAYWYAAHKNGDKAVDFAQKAIATEPRYVWSYIAMARGLMIQNRPLEAEEVLLRARPYGNFATLEYELASARLMAGFYREAVEGAQKTFFVTDGMVSTRIGGRIEKKDASFTELLADERRASILEPSAADDPEIAARLKSLLEFSSAAAADKPDDPAIAKAADAFVNGDDKFKFHRQLYAASLLLNKKLVPEKAYEYASAAIGGADAALDVPNAGAAVMASELYDSRQAAFAKDQLIHVPDVPRQTLSAILRGRIEELVGWALLQQLKPAEAAIHLRRSISILPENSAWWRSSMWRLGSALQADGKEKEALDAYIRSYSIDKPDIVRYTTVEALYKKLNGSLEGFEAKIGANPIPQVSEEVVAKKTEAPTEVMPRRRIESPATTALPAALPVATPPAPSAEIIAEPSATPVHKPLSEPSTDARPQPTPEPSPTPLETAVAQTTVSKTDDQSPGPTSAAKPLFEPITITIPKPEIPKLTKSESESPDPKGEKTAERVRDETFDRHSRVIEGKPVQAVEPPPCSISVSQENLSLLNNGGSLSILVGVDSEGELKAMRASSSSPEDVTVILEPDISGIEGRSLYLIRSISEKTGKFQILFQLPCGKKEIPVTVR